MTILWAHTKFEGLLVARIKVYQDDRGFFKEVFQTTSDIQEDFVQDNESFSRKNVLRGLHFQTKPYEQGKLVRVIAGKVQDIAVDLRPGSKTFKEYYEIILDGANLMYIPPGFAHGFLALEDSYFHYKCTKQYQPSAENGIIWNDPDLRLPWQIKDPIISDRDRKWPTLGQTPLKNI